jgi:outer membrane protein OmpA-like peptidoglycan-associated protein
MKLTLLFIFLLNLNAKEPIYYGVYSNFNFNSYTAEFDQLEGFNNCCPVFREGSGRGLSFGLNLRFPADKTSQFGLKLGLNNLSGQLRRTEQVFVNLPNIGKTSGEFTHYIDAKVKTITFEPYYSYNVFSNIFLNAGMQFSSIITSTFNSVEKITKPTNTGTFWDEELDESTNSRSRNQQSGEIPNISAIDLGLTFGISYQLQMNKDNTVRLHPELSYRQGLTNIITDNTWRVNNLNIGVSLFYTPKRYDKIEIEEYQIDTIRIEKDYIANSYVSVGRVNKDVVEKKTENEIQVITQFQRVDTLYIQGKEPIIDYAKDTKEKTETQKFNYVAVKLDMVAYDEAGKEQKLDKIKLEVELTREIYPLLPIIFFEENSKNLPERYNQISSNMGFELNDLEPNPIVYNRNTLNIIGQRMSENKGANISISGFIDPTTEQDCNLAYQRAKSIKDYLVNIFKINENRIEIIYNSNDCVPKDLTRTQSPEGYAENRRVEINSNMPELLFAVTNTKYEEPKTIKPPNILFKIYADNVISNKEFEQNFEPYPKKSNLKYEMLHFWSLNVNQKNNNLFRTEGHSQYSEIPFEFSRKNATELQSGVNLEVELKGIDDLGFGNQDVKSILVSKDTLLVEVEKLTLTVFKVSQATLDTRIKNEIKKFISTLDENSEIEITGYSDKLGNEIANKNLSAVRAEEVKKYISSIAPRAKFTKVVGIGSEEFAPGIKSYETPEERFISRTVEISIKKKRK